MRLQLDMAPTVGRTKGPSAALRLQHGTTGSVDHLPSPAQHSWASCQLPIALFGLLPTSHPITEMRLSVAHLSHRLIILWKD